MIGWLLDTDVVAELANPHGTARVNAWAAAQDERRFHLSILALGEYEKGLHNLLEHSAIRPRVEGALAALEARFASRLLPASNAVVRRWGAIGGASRQSSAAPAIEVWASATSPPSHKASGA